MALLAVSAMAFAQKDITDTYITNARLSDGTNGWTVKNFNAPQKGNNTKGYASESYAGWGSLDITEYGLTQTITLPAGSYRLANYSFFRQGLNFDTDAAKSLGFLKAGDTQVAIQTLGSITCNGYANSQAEGANAFDAKMYRNVVEFEIAEDGTEIEIGLVGTFDLKQSWIIAGMFELFDLNEEATADNPTDVTYTITNSGFEYRDLSGWENNGMQQQSNNSYALKAGGFYAEKWQASGGLPDCGIQQTINGLPEGYYTLSAYCSYGGDGAFVFANDKKTPVVAGEAGKYAVRVKVPAGEPLTIGYGLENGTSNYLCVDRFELSYYPIHLDALIEAYEALKQKALLLTDSQMNNDVRAALENAITDPEQDDDAYLEAITTLTEAIEAAEASAAYYAAVEKAIYDAMETFEYDVETGAFMEYLEEFLDNYYACTLVEDGSYVAEIAAARAYARKQVTEPGTDMTITIVNPEVNGANGWTCEKPNGGNGPLLNGTAFEYWASSATSRDEAKFDYYQVIEGLPNGTYLLSAEMYNSLNGEEGAEFAPTCGLYGFSGSNYEDVRVDVDSDQLSPYRLTIDVTDNTLRLGVSSFERMAARWFVADNFHLILVKPAADIEIALPTVEATTEAITLTFDLAEAVEGVENPTFEGTMLVETADGNVYMGGFSETDVVDGKVVVEVPTFVFFNMADYSSMTLNAGDELTISFPGVTLYENFTAGGYETLFEGELEGNVKATVGTVDAIKGITVSNVKVQYNLAGQRVNNAKGIVIENGKKVVK